MYLNVTINGFGKLIHNMKGNHKWIKMQHTFQVKYYNDIIKISIKYMKSGLSGTGTENSSGI